MMPEANHLPEDLEQLQQQLTEFRGTHRGRTHLPEPFWAAATEAGELPNLLRAFLGH